MHKEDMARISKFDLESVAGTEAFMLQTCILCTTHRHIKVNICVRYFQLYLGHTGVMARICKSKRLILSLLL